MRPQQELARAYQLSRKGKHIQAERLCKRLLRQYPKDAPATHLLGLINKNAGNHKDAEKFMRKSLQLDSRIAEFHANLANLLRHTERFEEAATAYRKALKLDAMSKQAAIGLVRALAELQRMEEAEREARLLVERMPLDPEAWSVLAMTVRDQGRLDEAEDLYRKSVAIGPGYAAAHHNLGSVLCRLDRAEEALEALERASEMGVRGYEIEFNLGRTFLQLYRFDEAERAFANAVAENPRAADAQINLARVRFMRGDVDFARDIRTASSDDHKEMRRLYGIMLRRAGDLDGAESHFRDLLDEDRSPETQSLLAEVLHEQGRPEDARIEILPALETSPDDPIIVENAAAILLACGRGTEAMPYIQIQRARSPDGQGWIAYEATAARLLGMDLYEELYDYDWLTRTYDVEAPPGWSSMDELNTAVLEALELRHQLPVHPLDQSLRNGSQTARSMLTDPDPAIRAIIRAFEEPIEAYRSAIGSTRNHLVSRRNTGSAQITGAWSVKLRRDGYHVNHFHPEGWISSAYYVSPPAEVNDESRRAGWLKFGEPRFPVPGAKPERFVQPRAGRLALFPSYMWHGTTPITGNEPRTTIAFDASPSAVTVT